MRTRVTPIVKFQASTLLKEKLIRGKSLLELWVTTLVNQTKIKGDCQSGKKLVPHYSKSDLPLDTSRNFEFVVTLMRTIL